jgi:hypothetical protein
MLQKPYSILVGSFEKGLLPVDQRADLDLSSLPLILVANTDQIPLLVTLEFHGLDREPERFVLKECEFEIIDAVLEWTDQAGQVEMSVTNELPDDLTPEEWGDTDGEEAEEPVGELPLDTGLVVAEYVPFTDCVVLNLTGELQLTE